MNFLRSNNLKKISASVFMALFVFVHAVKTFHTHEYLFSNKANTNSKQTNVASNFYCAICDFQLAKDSDAEVSSIHVSTPVTFISFYYHYAVTNVITTPKELSVRGPPVVA